MKRHRAALALDELISNVAAFNIITCHQPITPHATRNLHASREASSGRAVSGVNIRRCAQNDVITSISRSVSLTNASRLLMRSMRWFVSLIFGRPTAEWRRLSGEQGAESL